MKTNQQLLGPPLPFLSSKKCLIATTNLARLHDGDSGRTYRREYYFVLLFSFIHGFWFIITVFSMLVYLKVFPCMSLALEASSMKWNIWSGIQTEDV